MTQRQHHTGRLVATIILAILAATALINGMLVSATFWAGLAVIVGHPFVRDGKLDLHYAS